jgi:hypothetical protein
MWIKRMHRWFLGGLAVVFIVAPVALLLPGRVVGTPELMTELPAYNKFQCVLCHTTEAPMPAFHPLNAFGEDFLSNGSIWNETLAVMNSDRDRCPNGFEIGDWDGDGVLEEESVTEHSNPGDPTDCSIALTRGTWGLIKQLFGNEQFEEAPYFIP